MCTVFIKCVFQLGDLILKLPSEIGNRIALFRVDIRRLRVRLLCAVITGFKTL